MLCPFALSAGYRRAGEEARQAGKDKRHNKISQGDRQREQFQTRRARHPYRGNQPNCRGSGEPLDPILPHKDDTRADEADAGDNLRGDAGRVQYNTAFGKNIHKAVFRNQLKKGGGGSDDGIGTEARAFVADFSFQADGCGKHERCAKLDELFEALPGYIWDQHAHTLTDKSQLNRLPRGTPGTRSGGQRKKCRTRVSLRRCQTRGPGWARLPFLIVALHFISILESGLHRNTR